MPEAVQVKVARVHPDSRMPTKGSAHAAGWDLYSLEDTEVPFRGSVKLRTGLHVAIPVGYEGQGRARSSLGSKGLYYHIASAPLTRTTGGSCSS